MTNRSFALLLLPVCGASTLVAQRPPRPAPVPPVPIVRDAPAPWPAPYVVEAPLVDVFPPDVSMLWDRPMLLDRPMDWDRPMLWDLPMVWDVPGAHAGRFDFDLPLAPDQPFFSVAPEWDGMAGPRLSLLGPAYARQTPNDSLYRQARALLNRGEYRRAAALFQTYTEKNPGTRYTAAAMYWRAFALYRAGTDVDLRQSLAALDEQRRLYKEAAADDDVSALVTRVIGALARRGDAEAGRRLREGVAQGGESCDKEDMEVRAEALSALVRADPEGSDEVLKRTLARHDECAVPLRRRAVYLLGRQGEPDNAALLVDVAKNDPNERVRSDAVSRLAQTPGQNALPLLGQLFEQSNDEKTQRAVLQSLHRIEGADVSAFLRRVIEREALPEDVRADAIRSMGRSSRGVAVSVAPVVAAERVRVVDRVSVVLASGKGKDEPAMNEADAAFLRTVYGRSTSRTIRNAVLETLARSGGTANDQWLMGIVRNPAEEMRYRSAALGRLRRSDVPVAELSRLYDTLTERELRSGIVSVLGSRDDDAATDKLIEIAKAGTDPSIRRSAIAALTRKKDPRATKLLLELVEK